ncbi:hypothetical protein AGLY_003753 [Aphis glycines]|uniref:Uncharacterized protein n=1 Tax=Aphis glycines TaxID=307491 RepID=A0A6G0TZ87_APHGL|nr:hypothetical protein AGLY_003753 [Aphis glycines]
MINDANNDPSKKLVSQCLTRVVPRAHKPLRPLRRAMIATIENYSKFPYIYICVAVVNLLLIANNIITYLKHLRTSCRAFTRDYSACNRYRDVKNFNSYQKPSPTPFPVVHTLLVLYNTMYDDGDDYCVPINTNWIRIGMKIFDKSRVYSNRDLGRTKLNGHAHCGGACPLAARATHLFVKSIITDGRDGCLGLFFAKAHGFRCDTAVSSKTVANAPGIGRAAHDFWLKGTDAVAECRRGLSVDRSIYIYIIYYMCNNIMLFVCRVLPSSARLR